MTPSFEDNFNQLDVVLDGENGRWFAPIHRDFGVGHFASPNEGIFSAKSGILTIRAVHNGPAWLSATMQSSDSKGRGFTQRFGYFEIRAKLPRGAGAWSAFWLESAPGLTPATSQRAEIDGFEIYGERPTRLHLTLHSWPPLAKGVFKHEVTAATQINTVDTSKGFHRFGVLVESSRVSYFLDGRPIWCAPAPPAIHQPLTIIVTMALRIPPNKAPEMMVDYVRAYRIREY
jgi:beta-glucanase (GH16 family)